VERGISGGQEFGSRPAGSKLLASLQSGDIVIFPKLDRGFRNTKCRDWGKQGIRKYPNHIASSEARPADAA